MPIGHEDYEEDSVSDEECSEYDRLNKYRYVITKGGEFRKENKSDFNIKIYTI